MRRIGLVLLFSLAFAPVAAEAQQAGRIYRIGVLLAASPSTAAPNLDAFREGLRELGHVEGQTYVIEPRWSDGEVDRWPGFISELIRLPVDIIVVPTTGAALAAQKATRTIPIVSTTAGALVEAGVVASLARPGGNVTGLTNSQVDLSAKRLELIKEAVPTLSRVAALTSPFRPPALGEIFVRQTEAAARTLGLRLDLYRVEGSGDLAGAFQAAIRAREGAVIIIANPFFGVHATRVGELALQHKLPLITGDPGIVEAGGLMFYSVDHANAWRRSTTYVDRILKGAKPADLPVEQPTKFALVINLKTAKALGLTIPQTLRLRADQVIE
jgi:putative tryptophan/tyrosine transport system substrate-binding protein